MFVNTLSLHDALPVNGAGTVAQLVFFVRCQFGTGALALLDPEQWVVAEAMRATGGVQDPPAPQALAENRQRVFGVLHQGQGRSEEHTSELQSLMRTSYAVSCVKKKKKTTKK